MLAILLLVGLTVIGVGIVVSIGGASLDESRERAATERAEGALVSFGSQSGAVALGDAESAAVDLGHSNEGRWSVANESGSVRVTHTLEDEDATEEIYHADLGALRYQDGDIMLGYQAGGVWRAHGNSSVMISPPAVTYQGETLTMPLIRVSGEGQVSGQTRSLVRSGRPPTGWYPNASRTYGATGSAYTNPVQGGYVTVEVTSAFYRAWAAYFRTRTGGAVSVDHANESVSLDLTAGGTTGRFQMPTEGNAVEIRGLAAEHGVSNFTVVLAPDDTDAAQFNNLQWAMYLDNGQREMELHFRKSGEVPDDEPCDIETVSMTLYYSDANGDPYEAWKNDTAFRTGCVDRDGDGVADETRLVANLTGSSDVSMTDISSSELTHFNPGGADLEDPITFDEHDGVEWAPVTYDTTNNSRTTLGRVTRHYMSSAGSNYDIVVDDKNSQTVNEDASWGRLDYDGEGRVTFMHITERDLRVTLTD